MTTDNDREWAVLRRLIEDEKSRAWAEMGAHVRPAASPDSSRSRFIPRGMVAAAAVLLAAVGLIFMQHPGKEPVTMDQLPFFASAGKPSIREEATPREQEMGRRLEGWIRLVNREASPSAPGEGIDSQEFDNDTNTRNRETMLERLFLESTQHQEV